MVEKKHVIEIKDVNVSYGDKQVLKKVNIGVQEKVVTALIGPSGCGKSTLLRCINRMNDSIDIFNLDGTITLDGEDIYRDEADPIEIRRRVGMVFQRPNPFPKSIYENVAYGLKIFGEKSKSVLDGIVEESLKKAALWDEVKDSLQENATTLSGGQQQRLCIARTIAVNPEVVLFDEPCSALDPIATAKVEELIFELKKDYTVVIVTHSMQQAARVSDYTAFLYLGDVVEFGDTEQIFTMPKEKRTEDYITGRFG